MSEKITDPRMQQFAEACAEAGVTPEAALQAAGLHRSVWFRWRSGEVSPTLRNWDAAHEALENLKREQAA